MFYTFRRKTKKNNTGLRSKKYLNWLLKLCKRRGINVAVSGCFYDKEVTVKEIIRVGKSEIVFISACSGCARSDNCFMFEIGMIHSPSGNRGKPLVKDNSKIKEPKVGKVFKCFKII